MQIAQETNSEALRRGLTVVGQRTYLLMEVMKARLHLRAQREASVDREEVEHMQRWENEGGTCA